VATANYRREAFDFIEGLNRHTTVSGLMDAAERAFNRFGFETIIVAGLPLGSGVDFSDRVIAKRWPAGWFDLYTQNSYERDDPVVRHCRRTSVPFAWADAPFDRVKEPRALEVMNRAIDFRMSKGFITPIHGIGGFKAGISLGGQDIDLNEHSKPALHLMSLYAFEAICKLMDSQPQMDHRLTARERETLSWASQGKTAYEIGAILHIGQRTVEEHLATAARKLGASNRTHAVAIAIRNRIIRP
jgi:LuxR family quorum sensing-dependent transcriptional regulator